MYVCVCVVYVYVCGGWGRRAFVCRESYASNNLEKGNGAGERDEVSLNNLFLFDDLTREAQTKTIKFYTLDKWISITYTVCMHKEKETQANISN